MLRDSLVAAAESIHVQVQATMEEQQAAFWSGDAVRDKFMGAALDDLQAALRYARSALHHVDLAERPLD